MKIVIQPQQFDSLNEIFLSRISSESSDAIRKRLVFDQNQEAEVDESGEVHEPRIKIGRLAKSDHSEPDAPPTVQKEKESKSIQIRTKGKNNEDKEFRREAGGAILDALRSHREERIRQAKWAYNVAIIFVVIGIIFLIVTIMYAAGNGIGHLRSVASLGVSVVSNLFGAVLFKMHRDTNNRLDSAISRDMRIIEKLI